jgi:hypothetical protein
MKTFGRSLGGLLLMFAAYASQAAPPVFSEATLTVLVVDENESPVEGAATHIFFEGPDSVTKDGTSDKDGLFTASARTSGVAFSSVRKSGFYDSLGVRFNFSRKGTNASWSPTNPVCKLVLKNILEPVPMFARKVLLTVPELNVPLGFDLEVGDWVHPYGNGKTGDFVFFVTRRWKSMEDFDSSVRLSFPKRLDGIQSFEGDTLHGSLLTSPLRAPDTGYNTIWERSASASPTAGRKNWGTKQAQNFLFRVRSVEDERGNLKEANYGKIYGDISSGGEASEKMELMFTYYFNPKVNNRSLEFDTTKNLAADRITKP